MIKVMEKLHSLHCEFVPIPANMTHIFQPLDLTRLDLTVNGSSKNYMKNKFITYYSDAVKKQLDDGKALDDIDVDFKLTTMKPLHAQWLVSMYNFFTTEKGARIILKGWKKAEIVGIVDESITIPSEDPFNTIYTNTS